MRSRARWRSCGRRRATAACLLRLLPHCASDCVLFHSWTCNIHCMQSHQPPSSSSLQVAAFQRSGSGRNELLEDLKARASEIGPRFTPSHPASTLALTICSAPRASAFCQPTLAPALPVAPSHRPIDLDFVLSLSDSPPHPSAHPSTPPPHPAQPNNQQTKQPHQTMEPLNLKELTTRAGDDTLEAMKAFIKRVVGTDDGEELRNTSSKTSNTELARLLYWLLVVGYSLRTIEARCGGE